MNKTEELIKTWLPGGEMDSECPSVIDLLPDAVTYDDPETGAQDGPPEDVIRVVMPDGLTELFTAPSGIATFFVRARTAAPMLARMLEAAMDGLGCEKLGRRPNGDWVTCREYGNPDDYCRRCACRTKIERIAEEQ